MTGHLVTGPGSGIARNRAGVTGGRESGPPGGNIRPGPGRLIGPGRYPMRTPCGGAIRSLLMPGGFRFPIGQEGIRPHEKSGGSGPGRN